jgi:hypothetical protein
VYPWFLLETEKSALSLTRSYLPEITFQRKRRGIFIENKKAHANKNEVSYNGLQVSFVR